MKYKILDDYNLIDLNQWRYLIKNSKYSNVFHSPEMYKLWESIKEFESFVYACVDNHGKIKVLITGVIQKESGREVFSAMTDIAEQEGVFVASESKIIKNLLNFKSVLVKDIMTPRTVLKSSDETQTIQEFFDENPNLRFSRVPLYEGNSDHITGYFLKDQLLEAIIKGNGNQQLKDIRRNILVTQRGLPIPDLFGQLIEQREHIALVVDEYGSVSGLVTQEDMIETLLGLEIMDEMDNIENLQTLARKSWKRRAKRLGIIDDFDFTDDKEE